MMPDTTSRPADQSMIAVASSRGDWNKVQRPAYRAEEGEGDRSDWTTLLKSALVVIVVVAGLTALLSGMMAQ